jgi:hypothetical protein
MIKAMVFPVFCYRATAHSMATRFHYPRVRLPVTMLSMPLNGHALARYVLHAAA